MNAVKFLWLVVKGGRVLFDQNSCLIFRNFVCRMELVYLFYLPSSFYSKKCWKITEKWCFMEKKKKKTNTFTISLSKFFLDINLTDSITIFVWWQQLVNFSRGRVCKQGELARNFPISKTKTTSRGRRKFSNRVSGDCFIQFKPEFRKFWSIGTHPVLIRFHYWFLPSLFLQLHKASGTGRGEGSRWDG